MKQRKKFSTPTVWSRKSGGSENWREKKGKKKLFI